MNKLINQRYYLDKNLNEESTLKNEDIKLNLNAKTYRIYTNMPRHMVTNLRDETINIYYPWP